MTTTKYNNTIYKGVLYTPEQIQAMREWISDCQWADIDEDTELTEWEILRGVALNYEGGLAAFISDNTAY